MTFDGNLLTGGVFEAAEADIDARLARLPGFDPNNPADAERIERVKGYLREQLTETHLGGDGGAVPMFFAFILALFNGENLGQIDWNNLDGTFNNYTGGAVNQVTERALSTAMVNVFDRMATDDDPMVRQAAVRVTSRRLDGTRAVAEAEAAGLNSVDPEGSIFAAITEASARIRAAGASPAQDATTPEGAPPVSSETQVAASPEVDPVTRTT